jgi:hypothetical protein
LYIRFVQNKTLKKNHVLSIESIFSKEMGGPFQGRWGFSPEKGSFYWDAAISSSCWEAAAGGEISASQSSGGSAGAGG